MMYNNFSSFNTSSNTTATATTCSSSSSKSITTKKHPFSVSEDLEILQFVQSNGTKNWRAIANQLSRSPKQVRERWNGHLNPSINKGPWSHDEDILLAEKQQELGNRWAEISRFLPGRTDTTVKNRWNTSVKSRCSELLKSSSDSINNSSRLHHQQTNNNNNNNDLNLDSNSKNGSNLNSNKQEMNSINDTNIKKEDCNVIVSNCDIKKNDLVDIEYETKLNEEYNNISSIDEKNTNSNNNNDCKNDRENQKIDVSPKAYLNFNLLFNSRDYVNSNNNIYYGNDNYDVGYSPNDLSPTDHGYNINDDDKRPNNNKIIYNNKKKTLIRSADGTMITEITIGAAVDWLSNFNEQKNKFIPSLIGLESLPPLIATTTISKK